MEIHDDSHNVVPMTDAIGRDLAIQRAAGNRHRACPLQCRHVIVDDKARTVICRDCGFVLDPFQYILDWANEGDRRMQALRAIEVQRKVGAAECESLARRIKNLRETLKRNGDVQPPEERQQFNRARWNPHLADAILKVLQPTTGQSE